MCCTCVLFPVSLDLSRLLLSIVGFLRVTGWFLGFLPAPFPARLPDSWSHFYV